LHINLQLLNFNKEIKEEMKDLKKEVIEEVKANQLPAKEIEFEAKVQIPFFSVEMFTKLKGYCSIL